MVKHLESLIQKLKGINDEEGDVNPKAPASEEADVELHAGEEFSPSPGILDGPDAEIGVEGEPHKRDGDPEKTHAEARLMTHRYSNPYCDSCIRAKMKHVKAV